MPRPQFCGENFHKLVEIKVYRGESFRRLLTGVATKRHAGENFHEQLQNLKIHESFLPQKFPAVQYIYQMRSGNQSTTAQEVFRPIPGLISYREWLAFFVKHHLKRGSLNGNDDSCP